MVSAWSNIARTGTNRIRRNGLLISYFPSRLPLSSFERVGVDFQRYFYTGFVSKRNCPTTSIMGMKNCNDINDTATTKVSTSLGNDEYYKDMLEKAITTGNDNDNSMDTNCNTNEIGMIDRSKLSQGTEKNFYVVGQYNIPKKPFDLEQLNITLKDQERLRLTPNNITLPVALLMVDPTKFQTLTNARKECRKKRIFIYNTNNNRCNHHHNDEQQYHSMEQLDSNEYVLGKVDSRVYPGDILGRQVPLGTGYFNLHPQYRRPPVDLPVVYEDDNFAIVNKPAGMTVYKQRGGGDMEENESSNPDNKKKQKYSHSLMNVKATLPFVLTPPKEGTYNVMRYPKSVHRLDKPTSGLLVVGKTLPAMQHLSKQFHDRTIHKTYTAIVNGIPKTIPSGKGGSIMSSNQTYKEYDVFQQLQELVEENKNDNKNKNNTYGNENQWNVIDHPLDGKSAITFWRVLRSVPSHLANDGYLTLVELKPKTGRFHQLRRHMAWVCECPIAGDKEYDGNTEQAQKLRQRGLFLCSNRITLAHPFYNTDYGRRVWNQLIKNDSKHLTKHKNVTFWFDENGKEGKQYSNSESNEGEEGTVMVTVSIDLPNKFESMLRSSEKRSLRLIEQEEKKETHTKM